MDPKGSTEKTQHTEHTNPIHPLVLLSICLSTRPSNHSPIHPSILASAPGPLVCLRPHVFDQLWRMDQALPLSHEDLLHLGAGGQRDKPVGGCLGASPAFLDSPKPVRDGTPIPCPLGSARPRGQSRPSVRTWLPQDSLCSWWASGTPTPRPPPLQLVPLCCRLPGWGLRGPVFLSYSLQPDPLRERNLHGQDPQQGLSPIPGQEVQPQ